jgi:WXG100 family type VII secretion target
MAGSSGASFQTDLPTMAQAAQHVAEVNQQIQGQLRQLAAQLDPLMAAWKGAAAVSYRGLHERWMGDAQKLNQVLDQIGKALVATHGHYSSTEDTNSAGFSHMAGALG